MIDLKTEQASNGKASQETLTEYWSLSLALRLFGDRWSLLIVRELLCGDRGFNELSRMLPDLSRTLLSQRLKRLSEAGIVIQHRYPRERGARQYRLTVRGSALRSVVESLGGWARAWNDPFAHDLETGVSTLLDSMRRSVYAQALPQPSLHIVFLFEPDASAQNL